MSATTGIYLSGSGRGQRPKSMIVACAEFRLDPALLTGAVQGDVFVVRNVVNLVSPYERGGSFASAPARV